MSAPYLAFLRDVGGDLLSPFVFNGEGTVCREFESIRRGRFSPVPM